MTLSSTEMKKQLRKEFIIKRRLRSIEEIESDSNDITDKLIQMPEFKKAQRIHIYMAFNNEVLTQAIFKRFSDKNFFVPEIQSDIFDIKTEEIIYDRNKDDFQIVKVFNKPPKDIDLFIVPGLCFAEDGHRIGYGGGYYDYLLKDKSVTKIGLCYDFQILKSVPFIEKDVPVDIIVSEKRIIEQKNRTTLA